MVTQTSDDFLDPGDAYVSPGVPDSLCMNTTSCPVCGNSGASVEYIVREQMIGTNEPFPYIQCEGCGARRLVRVPADLSPYYAASYIPFDSRELSGWRAQLRRFRNAGYFHWNPSGPIRWFRPDSVLAALARVGIRPEDRILDVGCGSGIELHRLAELGFRHLAGIDPFVPDTLIGPHPDGVVIRKVTLEGLPERGIADLVIANHVFEHVAAPIDFLGGIARLLACGGRCLLRTPIADSWAAIHYGPHWVQHDAPRHLVIHTERSVAIAAEQVGLRVADAWRDGTEFQFWGSEAYQQGKSLSSTIKAYRQRGPLSIWDTMRQRARANKLNRARMGDQACFVLVSADAARRSWPAR
jgi:SAM-dependent methyltransferase